MVATALTPGTLVRGKYRLEAVIGSGGMGTVVRAAHERLGQPVALKFLSDSFQGNPTVTSRFLREAQAAARIVDEHVVRILDVDETEDGRPFLVMEWLAGRDLEAVIGREGPLPVGVAVDYLLQACVGVARAHAIGIVHRDIKPANLFVATRSDAEPPTIKLLDFGISKVASSDTPSTLGLTSATTVVGSPHYMSPEQLKSSRDVDARTDVWSLGVVLYQMLSRSLPFTATSSTALSAKIASEAPRPLHEVANVPEALEKVVDRCLEKALEGRWQTVVDLAEALESFGTPERVERVRRAAIAQPTPSAAPPSRVTAELSAPGEASEPAVNVPLSPSPVKKRRRRARGLLLVASLSAVALAAGAWIISHRVQAVPIALPEGAGGIGFDDLIFAPGVHRLLVPSGATGRLDLIDPGTRTVTSVTGFRKDGKKGGHADGATSADEGRGWLFVLDRTDGTLDVVDPRAMRIVARVPLSGPPDYVRYVAATDELWVTEPDIEKMEIFGFAADGVTPVARGTIAVADGPEQLVVDPLRGRAYTHLWRGATVAIDLRTRSIAATWPNGCTASRGIALDASRGMVIAGCADGLVSVLEVDHGGTMVSRLQVGAGLDVIAYDSELRHLYLPSATSGTLAIVGLGSAGALRVLGTIPTAAGARCAAVDDRHQAWVCDPTRGRLLMTADPFAAEAL